jgi:Phosphotransferase enzyme family
VSIDPHEERETRRIILLRARGGRSPEVLLGVEETHRTLPEVEIPRWQRVAEKLTAALRQTCGIDAVSISSLETSAAESVSQQVRYEIMEPYDRDAGDPREHEWVAINGLVECTFRDPRDLQAVGQAVAQCTAYAQATEREPFGRLGWLPELQKWVQQQIGPRGLHLNGRFRQLNACPTFSLIRFETDGPAVWFKAVGAPNQREYAVTLALARSFSRFLPQILATRQESNGWLARESEGSLLQQCSELAFWEAAARDLAELQISSLGRSLQLLDPGARDLRAWALADSVKPLFQAMGECMERQNKVPPAALSREELARLSARVQDALTVLEDTGIHTTLGHLDMNPGNIVCSPAGCVFLDWAEAFLGHPFLTFEYLLEHFRRAFGQNHAQETQFVACYTSPWRVFVSDSDILRALEVAPLIAVFAYAAGNDLWRDSRSLEEPRREGYLRSLTRRMDREARALAERSVSCPS